MTKKEIITGAIRLIEKFAAENDLEIVDNGTDKAFEGTFWEGIFADNSNIPNIKASNDTCSIELRSFWGAPEIDLSREVEDGREMLIFNYSDSIKRNEKYEHTENYRVNEVRVDPRWDYKKCIEEVYEMIRFIEENKETSKEVAA